MLFLFRCCSPLLILALLAAPAQAHYLWTILETKGGQTVANVYFEESPNPGDGGYLDPIAASGKTWIRTVKEPTPKLLAMEEAVKPGKRWLSAPVSAKAPRGLESTGTYGVYPYGDTMVLLHYYARYLDTDDQNAVDDLAVAEQLMLDIRPHFTLKGLELEVIWKGEPAAKRPIYVKGFSGRKTLTTDENGRAFFPFDKAGRHLLRTYVELDEGGTHDGKEFEKIRHHATMTVELPAAQ
ncbi:DUF4198 domain-containing protein [Lignipirellula cremea]|uniref:Nickel uptake substrate-specific transmembrane region n=1 Tax=Lignipirellula cremea TaxID=2528010 RepID=A0A518DN31_9BACT|nr:DUF4198 domain-containing protein [Lignipirellula cremea]QDU93223.1 hypothetical protein Pla8534_10020 [Lignipirellula cremea]